MNQSGDRPAERLTRRPWWQFGLSDLPIFVSVLAVMYALRRDRGAAHLAIGTAVFAVTWVCTLLLLKGIIGLLLANKSTTIDDSSRWRRFGLAALLVAAAGVAVTSVVVTREKRYDIEFRNVELGNAIDHLSKTADVFIMSKAPRTHMRQSVSGTYRGFTAKAILRDLAEQCDMEVDREWAGRSILILKPKPPDHQ